MIDDELKQLGAHALREAFYQEFSALVNVYLAASEGLVYYQKFALNDMTSVYGRNNDAEGDSKPNIWTQQGDSIWNNCGHDTMMGAFEMEEHDQLYLNGRLIFKRVDGEWEFVGDKK